MTDDLTKRVEHKLEKAGLEIPYAALTRDELSWILAKRLQERSAEMSDAYLGLFLQAYAALQGIDIGKAKMKTAGGRPRSKRPKYESTDPSKLKSLPIDAELREIIRKEQAEKKAGLEAWAREHDAKTFNASEAEAQQRASLIAAYERNKPQL